MSYLRYFCLFAYSSVQHIDNMSSMVGALYDAGTTFPSWEPVFPPVLVRSVLLIILVLCVVLFALFVFVLCLMYPMLPVSLYCQFLVWLTIKFTLTFI
jgi:hypothetical protein